MSSTFLCHCGGPTSVKDSRAGPGVSIRRRRECIHCKERVTTWEMAFESSIGIIERAEAVTKKGELLLAAATMLLEELDSLRELTKAHRTIEAARPHGVLRQ